MNSIIVAIFMFGVACGLIVSTYFNEPSCGSPTTTMGIRG